MSSDGSKEYSDQEPKQLFDKLLPLIPNAVHSACHKYRYKPNDLEFDGLVQRIHIKLFIKNYAALRSLEHPDSLKLWLQKIADNLVERYVRQQRRNVSLEGFQPDAFAVRATQEEHLISEEEEEARKKRFKAALSKLTARQRLLFDLSYREEMKDAEIAKLMKITLKSVRELRYKLKMKLKRLLEKKDADSSKGKK